MTTQEYMELGDKYFVHTYNRYKIVMDKAKGVYIYDADGNLKNDDSLYDDQRRVVAYDENGINGIKIRVERNETADLEVHDADGNLLFK